MRILAVVFMALVLSACGSNKVLVTEKTHIVVMPDEGLWQCPDVPKPPVGEYTQAEVADYILQLYSAHQQCWKSIEDVKRYLEQAAEITERVQK